MLNKEKLGKFTASEGYKLFVGGKGVTRDKYIFQKAEEIVRGHFKKSFSNKDTDHGNMNEYEAIESFSKVTGLIVESLDQQYFPINDNCGSTPDAKIVDFSGKILASCDVKCPTETFFEQKMLHINESKPQYQNCPKAYFYQAQMQMMSLGVDEHYLVRYMTNSEVDEDGNKIEYNLPLEVRCFYKKVTADKKVQAEILKLVDEASKERDAFVKILTTPVLDPIELT